MFREEYLHSFPQLSGFLLAALLSLLIDVRQGMRQQKGDTACLYRLIKWQVEMQAQIFWCYSKDQGGMEVVLGRKPRKTIRLALCYF